MHKNWTFLHTGILVANPVRIIHCTCVELCCFSDMAGVYVNFIQPQKVRLSTNWNSYPLLLRSFSRVYSATSAGKGVA